MLKNKLNITAFFIAVLLIISLTDITAFAAELPDLNIRGTLTVSMKKDGKPLPGGEFKIYRIANVFESNGELKYAYTNDFRDCGLSLNDIETDDFAFDMESYVVNNGINGISKKVDNNGNAQFSSLKAGIYFVIQSEAAKGYSPVNSFTVTLPYFEDGKYNYTVVAKPKLILDGFGNSGNGSTVKSSTEPYDDPNSTDNSNHNDNPNYDDGSNHNGNPNQTDSLLPKTGQLNLPIPILTALGICMIVSGLVIRCSGRKEND